MNMTYFPTHTRMSPWIVGMIFAFMLFNTRDKRVQFSKVSYPLPLKTASLSRRKEQSLKKYIFFSFRSGTRGDMLGINAPHFRRMRLVHIRHSAVWSSNYSHRVRHIFISDTYYVAHWRRPIGFGMRSGLRRSSQLLFVISKMVAILSSLLRNLHRSHANRDRIHSQL